VDIYFFGEVLLADGVDFVGAGAFSKRFGDRQVEASEQLSHSLSFTAKQHGHSLTAVMGNRHAPDRAHVAEGDLAMFHELPDVRQALV
jgi:hypothetical protein